jgi:type II secretory pathway pseudopilin PulG
MSPHRSREQRGNTIVEMLMVIGILGLLMTMLVSILPPLLQSPARSQAKLDTVQAAAQALYRIQRDLRQTYYLSAFACTTGAGASCSQPTAFATSLPAIAMITAHQSGTGQFAVAGTGSNLGYPNWQGVTVYWIDANGALHWAFYQPSGFPESGPAGPLSANDAAAAVAAATTGSVTGTQIATGITQLSAAWEGQPNVISFEMIAQSTENGHINETTYRSDVLARQ